MDTAMLTTLYVATFLSGLMPGPCTVLAAARTASGGVRSGLLASAGVLVGIGVLTGLAFGALVGVLTISDRALSALKWAGVATLVLLAAWTLRPPVPASPCGPRAARGGLCAGLGIAVSSPFVLMFQLALLPQFVAAGGGGFGYAAMAAGAFAAAAAISMAGGILLSAVAVRHAAVRGRWVSGASAGLLIAFAGAAAFSPVG